MNVYANVETRGSSEQAYEQLGTPGTAIPTLPQNFALGGLRVSTIVQGGVQMNLPLRNRVAQADAARDQVQVRQVQARTEKLENQIRQDIENAQIALETSFAAYQAAVNSPRLPAAAAAGGARQAGVRSEHPVARDPE